MAVYTQVSKSQVKALLDGYSLGKLSALNEISGGIENTNYFLDTCFENELKTNRYVLTIFENTSKEDLPFFNDLTSHLAREGFKVPAPVRDDKGESIFEISSKPAMIVQYMSGGDVGSPTDGQCSSMAGYLAQMHLSLREFPRFRPLSRGADWMEAQAALLEASDMSESDLTLLKRSIASYQEDYRAELTECPQGIVHGDLFRDNVLFEGDEVSGVIDFYHACQATLLFDLAVMVNDWAWNELSNGYDLDKMKLITQAYQTYRPWTEKERSLWPRCLEVAALRFWISRLVSFHLPGYQQHSVEGDTAKNPDEMKAVLLSAQEM